MIAVYYLALIANIAALIAAGLLTVVTPQEHGFEPIYWLLIIPIDIGVLCSLFVVLATGSPKEVVDPSIFRLEIEARKALLRQRIEALKAGKNQ